MEAKMQRCCHYPQFAVMQPGQVLRPKEKPKRYSMHTAARIIAEGGDLVGEVVESDGTTRPISEPEQQQLMAMSEDWKQQS